MPSFPSTTTTNINTIMQDMAFHIQTHIMAIQVSESSFINLILSSHLNHFINILGWSPIPMLSASALPPSETPIPAELSPLPFQHNKFGWFGPLKLLQLSTIGEKTAKNYL
jgi:hypothetical protein